MNAVAICSRCKLEKVIDDFPRDKNRKKNGRYPQCKACRREKYLLYRDLEVEQQRVYNATHRKEISISHRRYAAKRFFYIRASNLRLRHDRTEICASYHELASLWRKQKGCCPISGRRLTRDNSHLDHILPKKLGGTGTIENLRWVHRDVNYAKRDLSDADFLQLCTEIVAAAHTATCS